MFILFLCQSVSALDYQSPFQIMDGIVPLEISAGHGNPLVTDWNGDGLKDLIVGQYGEGKLSYYENKGSNESPVFNGFSYMQADGIDISVSYY